MNDDYMPENLPAEQESKAIARAADEDAGFEKMLKFKKGDYECDGEDVPLGTKFIAHCVGWTKAWIKFIDQQVVERKLYRVADGRRPPEREELDMKERIGVKLASGLSDDPWVYQYLLPLESEAGDLVIFVTQSTGGKRAIADLCKSYARREGRTKISAQPIIRLGTVDMPTKNFGPVPRPNFEIIGWQEGGGAEAPITHIKPPDTLRQEMDDEIPF